MDNMSFAHLEGWQQITLQDSVLLIQPEIPDWIVLSKGAADSLASSPHSNKECYDRQLLENALAIESASIYQGRESVLELGALKECWFHLTDTCNLSCRHCLFAASPAKDRSILPHQLEKTINEALLLGCKLFSFTGGEPFMYPGFLSIVGELLRHNPQCHAAVLTNGMILEDYMADLEQMERLHLQISLDGLEKVHDYLRGHGSFKTVTSNLQALHRAEIPFTLSVAVSRENINDLPALISLGSSLGAASIHFLYHFIRGKGSAEQFLNPQEMFPKIREAWLLANKLGLKIDNIETLRSQVFSTPGTRYDLSNTGWESIAIGPDEIVYPSPALIGLENCSCGSVAEGLEKVWKNSEVLQQIRTSSLVNSPEYRKNPLKYLVGGGDIDHSMIHHGNWVGGDPYVQLYNKIILQLIEDQAALYTTENHPIRLRMGDVRHDCLEEETGNDVALTHCNCLISLASNGEHSAVREFYGQAALRANTDILNPLAPAQQEAEVVPESAKLHSYGCGSPVTDGAPARGEVLVDLGSGGGVECFMAAEAVGKEGRVVGIDMTDEMLKLANEGRKEVANRLGFQNVEFKKGFLEQIPLDSGFADVVISNCVINLSPDKRMTYQEIFRILKPGGRLVVSDIVTDTAIPTQIKNNVRYRGECLGGAMQQEELVAMMESAGFVTIRFIKRFPYRQVEGMDFFSLTYEAIKPEVVKEGKVQVIYRGPQGAVITEDGTILYKGRTTLVSMREASRLGETVFQLDEHGAVNNIQMENSCCAPQTTITAAEQPSPTSDNNCCGTQEKLSEGCMVCGEELHYFQEAQELTCSYCRRSFQANAACKENHFVCDDCHKESGMEAMQAICQGTKETDLLTLLKRIRSHPAIPMHGPEHHAMMPAIILTAFRNRGGNIDQQVIDDAIKRGAAIPGGACGFWGACGAAIGAGIAASSILSATPLTPSPRQQAQSFSARILGKIAKYKGGRCCQRETWLTLTETAALSESFFGVELLAKDAITCDQYTRNKECIRKACPLWKTRDTSSKADVTFIA